MISSIPLNVGTIHFIGIGGCGMSGLAFMLKRLGAICEGSDSTASDLTDALAILINAGKRAAAITAVPPEDVFGINSRAELAMVNRVMRDRINAAVMDMGVTIVDPQSTWIDARATIGQDTVIHPFSHIGPAAIGRNCVIGPFARLSGGARPSCGGAARGSSAADVLLRA